MGNLGEERREREKRTWVAKVRGESIACRFDFGKYKLDLARTIEPFFFKKNISLAIIIYNVIILIMNYAAWPATILAICSARLLGVPSPAARHGSARETQTSAIDSSGGVSACRLHLSQLTSTYNS